MMIDYAPVVRSSFPGATPQAGLGEFFALPIFTCAGLMYLVSAIDFVFIFVSLELVTISFYVLVSFTRRNPMTLEAGTKYLVLSAPFDGISRVWDRVDFRRDRRDKSASNRGRTGESGDGLEAQRLLGMVFVLVALGFKIAAVPFQIWVPGCLSRRAYAGDCVPFCRFESSGIYRAAPRVAAFPGAAANTATDCCDCAARL